MKARSRRSRFVARMTILAAAALFSTSLSTAAPALAATHAGLTAPQFVSSARGSVAVFEGVALVPPTVHHRSGTRPHLFKDIAGVSPTNFSADARAGFSAVALAACVFLVGVLGTWLLEFVGKSSRTRGQPRMGALSI